MYSNRLDKYVDHGQTWLNFIDTCHTTCECVQVSLERSLDETWWVILSVIVPWCDVSSQTWISWRCTCALCLSTFTALKTFNFPRRWIWSPSFFAKSALLFTMIRILALSPAEHGLHHWEAYTGCHISGHTQSCFKHRHYTIIRNALSDTERLECLRLFHVKSPFYLLTTLFTIAPKVSHVRAVLHSAPP